jgi:virulence factor Mce-like protein
MKRVLGILLALGASAALAVFATGASNGSGGHSYWVELDDAFGLISGGDVKIAGVRAGKIGDMKVDQRTHRALVKININKTGFGDVRTDVTCQARPESLIGEYFIDCQPGVSKTRLKPGSTIPVSRTSSVVAPDLVNDVLRLPYRQRFSIIVDSLGAAVAGNAQNLNDAIRRASPGLQQTDRVLKILARQNHVLQDLVKNADTVIGDLSDNRAQVARWVVMADRTSSASAQRSSDISAGWHRLPGFLQQLKPAMRNLGQVADEQTPALRTLSAAAPDLKTFFDRLTPFAKASLPATQALGKASETGRVAAQAAPPVIDQLDAFAKGTPELGNNLAIILEHLDNPNYVAEHDPRSPGGKGYTGLQALLEYVYDQVMSVNIYDQSVHILKVAPFVGPCADYADVKRAKSDNGGHPLTQDCGATLGPNSAGLNFPDTTQPDGDQNDNRSAQDRAHVRGVSTPASSPGEQSAANGGNANAGGSANSDKPAGATTLNDLIPGAPRVVIPTTAPGAKAPDLSQPGSSPASQARLLDFLLAP